MKRSSCPRRLEAFNKKLDERIKHIKYLKKRDDSRLSKLKRFFRHLISR